MPPKGHRQDSPLNFALFYKRAVETVWDHGITKLTGRIIAESMDQARNTVMRRMHELGIASGSSGLSLAQLEELAKHVEPAQDIHVEPGALAEDDTAQ
jgi:hypothetical protein